MKAVILVGGEGTRLRPLTVNRLKSTVPMANRPFLEYQFALLRRHGVREIVLSICHQPEQVRRVFGDGRRFGVRLRYAAERTPLGTAGAIKNAEPLVAGREPVAVLNGDELSDWDFTRMAAVHRRQRSLITIGLTWVADPSAYGLVQSDRRGRITRFIEKPSFDEGRSHWVNSGLYIFSPEAFSFIRADAPSSAERELFPALLAAGERLWAYASRRYWKDIGTTANYLQAHWDLLEQRLPLLSAAKPWRRAPKVLAGPACRIHAAAVLQGPSLLGGKCQAGPEARIGELAVLGTGVKIGARAQVERSVLWDRVVVGEGARLSGCVLGTGCRIGRFAVLQPGTVLGDGAVVPDYSRL
ncbi:MAG: NDP-sugar synthase [candidate division FCPU426 bacterium]